MLRKQSNLATHVICTNTTTKTSQSDLLLSTKNATECQDVIPYRKVRIVIRFYEHVLNILTLISEFLTSYFRTFNVLVGNSSTKDVF